MTRLTLLVLVTLTIVNGCASSTAMISEEERCLRFGGAWKLQQCEYSGSGGSM